MSFLTRAASSTALPLVLGLALQAPAWAQSAAMQAARAACSAELQAFCAGVQPGGGRLLACLKDHRDQVSAGCKQAVKSALQGLAGAAPAPESAPASGAGAAASGPPTVGSGALAPAAAGSQSTPPAVTSGAAAPSAPSASPAAAAAAVHAASGNAHYYQLKRFADIVPKDASHEEMKVFSLLAPTDWNLVAGFSQKNDVGSCFSDLMQATGVVSTGNETYGMTVIPHSTYRYADDPAIRQQMERQDRWDEKFKLQGCPIAAPMRAADYIRENLVWKVHADKPQVTSEPFPELEQLVRVELGLGQGGAADAGTTRVEAARVRTSTTSAKGLPVDEWWSAVIVVRAFPLGRGAGYDWHAEQIALFQAPKGELDGYDKLQRVMATSLRFDPQFQSFRNGFIANLQNKFAQERQKQSAMIAAFQQHAIETIQGVTANQQRGSMVAARGADQLVRGVQTFRDPSTGRTVELSNLYDHAWADGGADRYIVTDDPNFNPNGRVNGDWNELQLVQPQP